MHQALTNNSISSQSISEALSYIKPVSKLQDLIQCFKIVYENYLNLGYIQQKQIPLHFSYHNFFPGCKTGALVQNSQIIGTGSIVEYSSAGLPSLETFFDKFEPFINSQEKIAEGTMFASKNANSINAGLQLAGFGISYCLKNKIRHFFVTVNKKHVLFWNQYLGFEILSDARECSSVNSAGGVLMHLDLSKPLNKRVTQLLNQHNTANYMSLVLRDIDIISLIRLCPEVWKKMPALQRLKLEDLYPGISGKIKNALKLGGFAFHQPAL